MRHDMTNSRVAVEPVVEPPAEVWPKYYAPIRTSNGYYKCTSEDEVWHVCAEEIAKQSTSVSTLKNTQVWREITEAEALARVRLPEPEFCVMCGVHSVVLGTTSCGVCIQRAIDADIPVESPDDWVTQDRVPARPGIDQRSYADDTTLSRWQDAECLNWDKPAMHGTKINKTTLQLRCRRKDLPVESPPIMNCPDCGEFRGHGHDDCCPMAWVEITDPEHMLRAGIDEFRHHGDVSFWGSVLDSHGLTCTQAGFLAARCRRKDLPTAHPRYLSDVTRSIAASERERKKQPAGKRVPVRLGIQKNGVVFAVKNPKALDDCE
jgi:hypothetical protein